MLHHVAGSRLVVMSFKTLLRTLKRCVVHYCKLTSTIIYFYKNNFIFQHFQPQHDAINDETEY